MRFYNGNVYVRATLRGRQASKQAGTKKVIAYFRLNGKTQTLYAIMCYVTRCIEFRGFLRWSKLIERVHTFHPFTLSFSLYHLVCQSNLHIFSSVIFLSIDFDWEQKNRLKEAHILDNVFFFLLYGCCYHCYFLSIGNFLNIPSIFHSKNGNVLTFLLNYFICMGSFGIFFAILFAYMFDMDFERG